MCKIHRPNTNQAGTTKNNQEMTLLGWVATINSACLTIFKICRNHKTSPLVSCPAPSLRKLIIARLHNNKLTETRGWMRDYQSFMVCITPTTACPLVSFEKKTMITSTSEATMGVHTAMITAVATLAFISICIQTWYTNKHPHCIHIHTQVAHSPLHVSWSEFNV